MDELARIERRLKLRDVRMLIAVVQAGSMGRAAERMATSQPAVSRSIADLERALGARLLDRSPQGIEPTPAGRALIKRAVVVFDELRQSIKDVEFCADPMAGEVRIAASVAVAVSFVAAVVERLSRRHPRLTFQVLATDTGAACRLLEERSVDLVIVHVIGTITEAHMNAEILYHEPQVVAAGTQNPWTRRRRIGLADLMNEPWTLPPPDSQFGAVVAEAFRANGLDLPRTVVNSSLPVRNALLATGRFLTMVPRSVLTFPSKTSELKSLPVDLPSTHRPVGIITLKNRTLNPVAELFINCARDTAKALLVDKRSGAPLGS